LRKIEPAVAPARTSRATRLSNLDPLRKQPPATEGGAMLMQVDALSIVEYHDRKLGLDGWPATDDADAAVGAWQFINDNHRFNHLLWKEEDKARRVDVDSAEIAASKRLIDRYNQQRNDAVERIDESLLAQLSSVEQADTARLSSETAGAMIDRLSILSLKIFHMREQTRRADAAPEHINACCGKLHRLMVQRNDLTCCLEQLLTEALNGLAYFKVYRQFKMYNDPSLNPWLYGRDVQAHLQ
jgi:hypothetical protein